MIMTDVTDSVAFTVDEAAKILRISRNSAYQAVKEGQIPSIRIGKRIVIPRQAFNRMLEEASQG